MHKCALEGIDCRWTRHNLQLPTNPLLICLLCLLPALVNTHTSNNRDVPLPLPFWPLSLLWCPSQLCVTSSRCDMYAVSMSQKAKRVHTCIPNHSSPHPSTQISLKIPSLYSPVDRLVTSNAAKRTTDTLLSLSLSLSSQHRVCFARSMPSSVGIHMYS